MSEYSISQYLSVIAALVGGVVVALLIIKKAYARSVRRLMLANSTGVSLGIVIGGTERMGGPARMIIGSLPAHPTPPIAALLDALSRARSRRALAVVAALLATGLLQGLVFLTVVEPGRVRLRGIAVAGVLFATPALLAWLLARTVSRGQPSELGLWAGLGFGLLPGAGVWVAIGSLGSVRFPVAAAAILASVIVGFVVLVAVAALLRRVNSLARLSPDALAAVLSCLTVGAFWGLPPALSGQQPLTLLYLAPALAFPPILVATFSILHTREPSRRSEQAPRLLILRTFGHATRSNRLLREFARVWLERGPIDLIAGPDLASSVVTLEKLHAWLMGRLRTVFIADSADFERTAATDNFRYRDGRYPVREYSCLESGWRDTVTALSLRADAIIMDLRSFTRKNNGCIFEIHTLTATVPPSRILFLVDDSTDLQALEEVFQRTASEFDSAAHWLTASPRVYRLDGDDEDSIRSVLFAAVEKSHLDRLSVHSLAEEAANR